MAADSKKGEEDDGGEFADFMADISQEIAQRVESLEHGAQGSARGQEGNSRCPRTAVSFSSGRTWPIE